MRVGELMHRTDETVLPDHPMKEAADRMARTRLACLPVVDGDEIVGMIVASDLLHAEAPPKGDKETGKVREHMSTEFAFCYEDDDVETARQAVAHRDDLCLCVTDREGRLVGVVSSGALVAATHDKPETSSEARRPQEERRVATPGRASGDPGGSPRDFSTEPKVRK